MRQVRSWPRCYRPLGATSTSQIVRRTLAHPICYQYVVLRLYMVRHLSLGNYRGSVTIAYFAGRLSDILGRKGAMLLALSFFGMS